MRFTTNMNKNLKCCHEIVRRSKSQNAAFMASNTAQDSYKWKLASMMCSSGWSVGLTAWPSFEGLWAGHQEEDWRRWQLRHLCNDNLHSSRQTQLITMRGNLICYKNCKPLKPNSLRISGNRFTQMGVSRIISVIRCLRSSLNFNMSIYVLLSACGDSFSHRETLFGIRDGVGKDK